MGSKIKVEHAPQFEEELEEAGDWYRKISPELAARILAEVIQAEASIVEAPTRWQICRKAGEVRRYLLPSFPYAVLYRFLSPGIVRLIAFIHLKRNPARWQKRW